jgi:hypothetical protein
MDVEPQADEKPEQSAERNDPWIILFPGALFIIVGTALTTAQQAGFMPTNANKSGPTRGAFVEPSYLHAMGWFGILVGLIVVAYYLKLRRELRKP